MFSRGGSLRRPTAGSAVSNWTGIHGLVTAVDEDLASQGSVISDMI